MVKRESKEPDIEEEWRELKERIKKSLEKNNKTEESKEIRESDLEKQLEESETEENNEEFNEVFVSMEAKDIPTTSLERIHNQNNPESQNLEENVSSASATNTIVRQNQNNDAGTNYSLNIETRRDEKEYDIDRNPPVLMPQEDRTRTGTRVLEISDMDFDSLQNQENQFIDDIEREKVNIDLIEQGKGLPFEKREDKKYKNIKL